MAAAITEAEARTRAQLIAVESYAVSLDLTDGTESARSRTEIRFSCREPGQVTFADLDAAAVHAIVLNGEPVDPGSVAAGRLPLRGLAASNTLTVDATVAVSAGGGLSAYADPADGNRYLVASCFPAAAGSVFCCFDQPDLRAPLSLVASLPAGWTGIANGEPVQRPPDGAAGVWRFSTVPAMKPYEFAFCAGPFVTAPPGNVHCRASLVSSAGAGLDRIARIVGAVLPHYEQLLGVPCPYPKVDIVCAPGTGPVAMQLPAVMYVSERLLQRAADATDEFVPVVLAHEVAHLWFGCLVEGRWWDDLWLAEAMATYLSYAAMTGVLGEPDAWAEFGITRQASAYQADGLPSTQPVSSPVRSAADALTRPPAVTYFKGTSVIRQLEAVLGPDAIWAGLTDYLTSYAWSASTLSDLIGCWSRAGGRDLRSWAAQWLRSAGVNELRPELTVSPDGVITSLAIGQQPPRTAVGGPLRTHRLTVGLYDVDGSGLRRTRRVAVTVDGARTPVPELTGTAAPAAVIINDGDQTFATIRFDRASWAALVMAAMNVSDPLTESVCWTAAFEMVQFGELDAAEFAALVARAVTAGRPAVGLDQLLDRAVAAADRYTGPTRRPEVREHLADAVLSATVLSGTVLSDTVLSDIVLSDPVFSDTVSAAPGGCRQQQLARVFADCAESPAQLHHLAAWLAGRRLPAGLAADLPLRARILASLAARDLVSDDDLAAYAAADPVAGETVAAECAARRPTLAAKETAWTAALSAGQSPGLALAHAQGFWVPGQERLTAPFGDRYFAEALPAVRRHDARTAQRLARALYPATLADETTLIATDSALAGMPDADPLRPVLLEQREILRRVISAREVSARGADSPDRGSAVLC